MLTDTQWTLDEKLSEVPGVTAETLQEHIALLLSKVNMRILINGNLYKDVSRSILIRRMYINTSVFRKP